MWSGEDVRRVAASLLPDAAAEAAVAAIRPGWRLETCDDHAAATVRVGGSATLVKGEDWPGNARGVPLTFLCEIDTGRLPPFPAEWADRVTLPADAGVLRLFADLIDNPYAPSHVLISSLPAGESRRVPPPSLPEPFPPGGPFDNAPIEHRVGELPATAARAIPFLTLPEWRPGTEWDADHAWRQLSYLVRVERDITWLRDPMRDDRSPDPWSISHVLGEPTSIQDDVRLAGSETHRDPGLKDVGVWQVLVALHSSQHLSVFDGGAYHVLVPAQDLVDGRWDRAVVDVSSH
jgi:Domain of unknown function (DUF1963)